MEIFPLTSNIPLFCLNVVLSFREGCRAWYDFSDRSKSSLSQDTSERQRSTTRGRGLSLNLWLFVMQNHFLFPFTRLPSPCAGPPSAPGDGEQKEIVFRVVQPLGGAQRPLMMLVTEPKLDWPTKRSRFEEVGKEDDVVYPRRRREFVHVLKRRVRSLLLFGAPFSIWGPPLRSSFIQGPPAESAAISRFSRKR